MLWSQTRTIELPSDSHFAVAMKSQKEAERAEQQRIKNLVLNLNESQENGDIDGKTEDFFLRPNPNLHNPISKRYSAHNDNQGLLGEKYSNNAPIQQAPHHHPSGRSSEKPGSGRSTHRARKLQLSDVDWSDKSTFINPADSDRSLSNSGGRGRGRGNGRHRGTHG